MKNKMIAAVAVLTLSASIAVAAPHQGGSAGKRGGHRGEFGARFAEKLNLTDVQKAKIQDIRKATREQNAAFFQSFRSNVQQFRAAKRANDTAKADALKATITSQRAQLRQIHESERQLVLTVLTPEQRAQLEQMKAERENRRNRR
ncbi:MAG: Spy/CpxP family protein refolding chaperone [Acidobacteriota bacterium]|nr:Spy/CpxP family protein refolding chaperone [Acidobacteriota bacterium]